MLMIFIRKLGLWASSGLLKTMLLSLALVSAVILVFGTPEHIKNVLKANDVYGAATDTILQNAKTSAQHDNKVSLPLDDPVIQKAFKDAFSVEFLSSNSDKILDSTFSWLNGEIPKPKFVVQTNIARNAFVESLGTYVQKRAEALPLCPEPVKFDYTNGKVDVFTATCRPRGVSPATIRRGFEDSFSDGKFLDQPILAEDLKDGNGKPFYENLKEAPKAYQFSKKTPLIFGTLALLMAAGVIFLHRGKRKGLRSVGISLVSIGVVLAGFSYLASNIFHRQIQPNGSLGKTFQNSSLQKSVAGAIDSLGQIFTQKLIWFGLAYAVLGVAVILIAKYWKNQAKEEDKKKEDPAKVNDNTKPSTLNSENIDL